MEKAPLGVLLGNKIKTQIGLVLEVSQLFQSSFFKIIFSVHIAHIHTYNFIHHKSLTTSSNFTNLESLSNDEIIHNTRSMPTIRDSTFSSQGSYSKPGLLGQHQGSWQYGSQAGILFSFVHIF